MRDLEDFSVIAIEFNKFTDGKGYSTARLLREQYGYKGELRAIGDVPRDTFQLLLFGFDAFEQQDASKNADAASSIFNLHSRHVHVPGLQLATAAG